MSKVPYRPDPAFLALGDGFADPVKAADFPKVVLRYRNDRAAAEVGLDHLSDEDWIRHFGRFAPLEGNLAEPLAQRYHGHQFRVYNPDIGDGRGFLFAQMRDARGRLMDLGTKGSGTTPYSRSGDGRLTLKGGVREIMATEMLAALGANTSRTFSLIETGESLHRGDEPSPTRSSVLVRLTHGHIRIGTFQRHAFFSDTERLEKLVDYSLKTYAGIEPAGSATERALALLAYATERTAENAADLMVAGFVHGVLNSDNINITGEVFDFGPWRFLPEMDLGFTAAYFDESGLYAYGRQPDAIHWDLYQLGGALADIAPEEELRSVLAAFPQAYMEALRTRLTRRLGLKPMEHSVADALFAAMSDFMVAEKCPYERFFFDWYGGPLSEARAKASPIAKLYETEKFAPVRAALMAATPLHANVTGHDYFRGEPCTMLIEEVEAIWAEIANHDDWQPLHDKIDRIRQMGEALGN
ncbi:protein adenylyltransferase SelO family protein [Pseudokordiimonas caeni]|uniref:protein adenylyltransferase SelO family protein n=1 Tax=Pseudokordiimonas caeni TaxID=2997908 RepID=UPI0028125365|nr:YdiU family protein [Pseudokordiimonas caeni]